MVLKGVLDSYKYASLPELNAVLQLYNVRADRGSEDSRIHRNRGLVYRILDDDGKPVGVPVKASLFYNKPTLSELERRFLKNEMERRNRKPATRNAVDSVLRKHPAAGLEAVVGQLAKQGVDVVLRQNKEGVIYGITYVDHKTGCVFNGSALGKEYSAKRMLERCGPAGDAKKVSGHLHEGIPPLERSRTSEIPVDHTIGIPVDPLPVIAGRTPLEVLTDAEQTSGYVPYDLRKRRKKKRRGLSK